MALLFALCISLIWVVQGEVLKFPSDFKFGVATSAYQIEGGWNASGKGENIWDRLVHERPRKIVDQTNGDIACDSYHKIDDDVNNLKWLGVDFYRFSLSWSRILPSGYANQINEDGVRYYNQLIDTLLANNITPMVTLYHWDLPQPLQEIGGWPNVLLADYFEDYARIAFRLFGDRVKMWITINEPLEICQLGYGVGALAPSYTSDGIGTYLCGRTLLLAHARAYRMYYNEFYDEQKGQVGFTVSTSWFEPATNSTEDIEIAERSLQMNIGWWAHPIFSKTGDYPEVMKQRIDEMSREENFPRSRLVPFTKEEVELIQGTYDFFGLNHYSSQMVSSNTSSSQWKTPSQAKDIGANNYWDPSWPDSIAPWLKKVPWGFRKTIKWVKEQYDNPIVYITENGWPDDGRINDDGRIEYYRDYLKAMLEAIQIDGCDVRGYAAWSLMDNFEWSQGYSKLFGLFNVDFTSPNRTRVAKDSAAFYKQIIKDKSIDEIVVQGEILKFPSDFKFGVATSAYQIEGAWNESGKGENIWDRLVHDHPEMMPDRSNGDIACDSYHKTDEDVNNLKWLGVNFYRFSLSWSRLLPSGYANQINEDGVRYYNELIDALLANNITPMVTLYHWDLPQPLQEVGGWPNEILADYFEDYTRIAFRLFGDRVKMWITFNEPLLVCQHGYGFGAMAPARNSDGVGSYLCGRTLLLAHAKAYRMYRNEFYEEQKGQIGFTVSTTWFEPATNSTEDIETADRCLQMNVGWWTHPIFSKTGDFPEIMKQRIDEISREENFPRSRLVPFTKEEVEFIQGTYDFFGLNHYSTRYSSSNTSLIQWPTPSHAKDIDANNYFDPSWPSSIAPWLKKVPWGFRKILNWVKEQCDNPIIYITENGWSDGGELNDVDRIDYYRDYLKAMLEAIQIDGCDVRGYAAWTFMDNFEWRVGYTEHFGLFHVDFTSPNRTRVPKDSARFYKQLIEDRIIEDKN